MVFAMPERMTIEAMQRWVTEKLQLQGVYGCTKDLARLSFVVPRSYWLYVDYEALFEERRINPAAELRGTGAGAELRGAGAGELRGAGAGELRGTGAWNKPPRMPDKLPKLIRHLIKNVPEVCRPSVAHGVFPALATHLSEVNFRLIDGTKKEATFMCVNMARQSSGKASVNKPIEYIMADIKERDDINRRREQEWKDSVGTKGSNKEKPKRPDDLCVQMLVTDMTNAAFVQRLKDANGKYIYTNLEELDLLKQLQTNGTKDVGKIITDMNDKVLGVHAIGNPCSEFICAACVAIEAGMTAEQLHRVVFPHPTVAEIIKETAGE